MRLIVFDAPAIRDAYPARMRAAQVVTAHSALLVPVPWRTCASTADAMAELAQVQGWGGEGLMLHHPGLRYTPGRTASLVKVKQSTPRCE